MVIKNGAAALIFVVGAGRAHGAGLRRKPSGSDGSFQHPPARRYYPVNEMFAADGGREFSSGPTVRAGTSE